MNIKWLFPVSAGCIIPTPFQPFSSDTCFLSGPHLSANILISSMFLCQLLYTLHALTTMGFYVFNLNSRLFYLVTQKKYWLHIPCIYFFHLHVCTIVTLALPYVKHNPCIYIYVPFKFLHDQPTRGEIINKYSIIATQ